MSASLMLCVRDHSPPLEVPDTEGSGEYMAANATGPQSLQERTQYNASTSMTSTPLSAMESSNSSGSAGGSNPSATAQTGEPKRRRFHPLRNLRRIFRRRTITSVADTPALPPPASSTSEKNLRSATLTSISSTVSASSPSSPLTHQQLQDTYCSQSLPKSKSYSVDQSAVSYKKSPHKDVILAACKQQAVEEEFEQSENLAETIDSTDDEKMSTTTTSLYHAHANSAGLYQPTPAIRQSLGVAVLPNAMNRSFYAERQKLRSMGDSSQELDSSGHETGTSLASNTNGAPTSARANGNTSSGEMSDSQRSLSEGRLVDSDYCADVLSQSHDSVFSESAASTSIFSNRDYQAELSDVLRKRNRHRQDASEEDLALPRSPSSPQRRTEPLARTHHTNQSEVSSLSLLSMNSGEGDEVLACSTANNSMVNTETKQEHITNTVTRFTRSSTFTSANVKAEMYRHSTTGSLGCDLNDDEVDLFNAADFQRLSHSAARHKMAVRPAKKKGPSRQHRRTLETSIPEANEDNTKMHMLENKDNRAKTRSLPPGVNAKTLEQQASNEPPKPTALSSATPATTSANKTAHSVATATDTPVATTSKRTRLEQTDSTSLISRFTASSSNSSSTSSFSMRSHNSTFSTNTDDQVEAASSSSTSIKSTETTESGFLRRLMPRNSKRSMSRSTMDGNDEQDTNQSEPKKLQISTSCYDIKQTTPIATYRSKEQYIEETRKEIQREFSNGLMAAHITPTTSITNCEKPPTPSKDSLALKPKSGAAARQRYVPQDINSLERNVKTSSIEKNCSSQSSVSAHSECSSSSSAKLSPTEEIFQSTSIIRKINASQTTSMSSLSTKTEHHFEKKPKFVGLSAFQQKISRSNDGFGRTSTSTSDNSIDIAHETLQLDSEQSQRKSVEKSRSFRIYQEEKPATVVHNNMPSLPDLSLNLRLPCYQVIFPEKEYSSPSPPEPDHDKSNSLVFEINDNNLVRPAARAESTGQLHTKVAAAGYSKKSTPTKLLAPSMIPALSPSKSCSTNLSEIEQNIDLLVKSPFISVLRKSTNNNSNNNEEKSVTTISLNSSSKNCEEKGPISKPAISLVSVVPVGAPTASEVTRPKSLYLKSVSSEEKDKSIATPSPTAEVSLRDKTKLSSPNGRLSMHVAASKESTPTATTPITANGNAKAQQFKSRRSSSIVDSSSADETTGTSPSKDVPEFMKIQLNRVDPARIAKSSNVVLAKNIKETNMNTTTITTAKESNMRESSSIEELCFRRLSNESVEITEKETPEAERRISGFFEAINKQSRLPSGSSTRTGPELPPRSPVKKAPTVAATTPTDSEEGVQLRAKANDVPTAEVLANNKLSLLERKRLFMNENKPKPEKAKLEELRSERKKSLSETYRKSMTKSEEKLDVRESPTTPESVVVLRKKSFSASCTAATNSSSTHKDDSTPELMKVFARRSLKVKDEDLSVLNDKIGAHNSGSTSTKRLTTTQQNVDSDKENQSASEEKLDKLPKLDAAQENNFGNGKAAGTANNSNNLSGTSLSIVNNRNSLADFRNGALKSSAALSNGLSLNNNHTYNNNNNNNNSSNSAVTLNSNGSVKAFLPPIKTNAFRTIPIERNASVGKLYGGGGEPLNNNNTHVHNNNNNQGHSSSNKSTLDRPALLAKKFESSGGTAAGSEYRSTTGSKTIERSATVSEFKGIHQRRAEWEQRAKEALK